MDTTFEDDLIRDLEDDIRRYERRAAEHEADALALRRKAASAMAGIEYVKKSRPR
jgi:hypothetical protein